MLHAKAGNDTSSAGQPRGFSLVFSNSTRLRSPPTTQHPYMCLALSACLPVAVRQGDAHALPIEDGTADLVTVAQVGRNAHGGFAAVLCKWCKQAGAKPCVWLVRK